MYLIRCYLPRKVLRQDESGEPSALPAIQGRYPTNVNQMRYGLECSHSPFERLLEYLESLSGWHCVICLTIGDKKI